MKTVWRLSELGKIGEILNDSRTALTQEFLKEHPDWQTDEFLTTKKAVELILLDKKEDITRTVTNTVRMTPGCLRQ